MSTIKIAGELNRREIEPPAVYLKIPTYMKKQSVNPNGKYIWLRAQIGKILRNEVYHRRSHTTKNKIRNRKNKFIKKRKFKHKQKIIY